MGTVSKTSPHPVMFKSTVSLVSARSKSSMPCSFMYKRSPAHVHNTSSVILNSWRTGSLSEYGTEVDRALRYTCVNCDANDGGVLVGW